jgi:hypothetical protein
MPQRQDESHEEYRLRQQTKEGEAEMTFTLPPDYIPGEWITVKLRPAALPNLEEIEK